MVRLLGWLTSGQFSPRVLRTFLRDRFNQVTLGVFVATFVYAMAVLRAVRGTADVSPYVPQLAVTTAFVLVLASVLLFLFDYLDLAVDEIHHWGGDAPRIQARLRVLLRDVHAAARPEHRPVIARKLAVWGEPPPTDVGLELDPSDVGLRSRGATPGRARW